ncbi:hypothetical protein Clacol_009538 [Clathrus columnatus]|uniref:Major facilitator superfamily (MFS) profile domain-containing protein n=1 Tax=Clathrus columnatus TaxID=1419009 RepID=A0AAV5AN90_9AGAM|nr:hypothetical protein Clacol_009538 [Clathrus columnatus]
MADPIVHDESTPLFQNDTSETLYNRREPSQVETLRETIESNPPTPLPIRTVVVMVLLIAMTPLAFEVIFPFINQMILEVGIVDSPEEVGFYSGLIESIFAFVSLVAGYLADRVGRKPIILWGTFATAISTASFGMSKTLLAMILSRCVGGATGSVWVAVKTVMAENTDKTNQGKAFGYLTVAYRAGQILGLPLGGLLAHPERNFPFFRSKFWIENPFSLPCFVAAGTAIFSVILGYFSLNETLRSKRKQSAGPQTSETTHANNGGSPSLREILKPQVVGLLLSNALMCYVSEVIFAF